MRVTLDIPDSTYRRLESQAALRGCSVKDLVLRGVRAELERPHRARKKTRVKFPIIHSKRPGWLRLTNRIINEVFFF